jgi:hypothetical protein
MDEKKDVKINREQPGKLEDFYFQLSCALKQNSFRSRFALYTGTEKIEVIRKYVRALEILDIRVPDIDPLIANLLKPGLLPGRVIWAPAGFREESEEQ